MVEGASSGINPIELQNYPPKEITPGVSLPLMQDYFIGLYGRRNNVYLDGRVMRINFLNIAIGDLQDAIRKDADHSTKEIMISRLVSRIFCIAHGINNISVANAMMEKYPPQGCTYCGKFPCSCGERRPEPTLAEWNPQSEQRTWSLKHWQTHLKLLYGEKNEERGTENTLNRLSKEITELLSFEYNVRDNDSMDEIERTYALELADCLAWTIAMANLLNIDLEKVTIDRFGAGCWKCKQNPCVCGKHNLNPVDTDRFVCPGV